MPTGDPAVQRVELSVGDATRALSPAQVGEIIAANADKATQARQNPKLLGWFVGQVMKASGGKANPQAVNDLLKSKLGI